MTRVIRTLAAASAIAASIAAAHSIWNSRTLPTAIPPEQPREPGANVGRISLLLPARNEAENISTALTSAIRQSDVDEIIVLDDASTDHTAAIATDLAGSDLRVQVHRGAADGLPLGWLGKAWACERLSHYATGDVLVFIDADVELNPGAVAAATAIMRDLDLDMVCPYPRQQTTTALTRLVQPLLQWSWLTFVPNHLSMRKQLPSMAVGNGQFLVVNADSYRRVGGHESVANEILEDVALARAFRVAGLRTAVVDGSAIAQCRMYTSDRALVDGYTKSLWSAFGSTPAAVTTMAVLTLVYVLPAVLAIVSRDQATRRWGALGYVAAVGGRVAVARRTGQRVWPDSLAAPASVVSLAALTGLSLLRHRRGTITWKGRALPR